MVKRVDWNSISAERKPPTFMGVGGHKCASTWISECMREHPEVFVTDPKETGYFVDRRHKGLDWYASHFDGSSRYKARGEFTSYYLYDPVAARLARDALGVIPIIAVVRDPVERSLSQIKHALRMGVFSSSPGGVISLSDLRGMIERYPIILSRSLYFEGISGWIEQFGRDNVLVLDQAFFRAEPERAVSRVWRFLGVDEGFVPSRVRKDVSLGINPRWRLLERMRITLYRRARPVRGLVPLIRKTRLPELYRKVNAGASISLSYDAENWIRAYAHDDWESTKNLCWPPDSRRL